MYNFNGKVALITGAAGTIGKATAISLADSGAAIVAVDRPGTDWQPLKKRIAGKERLTIIEGDVSSESDVINYVETAVETHGKIDIFFNNAGIEGPAAPIEEYPADKFQQVFDVNVFGCFLGLKYVLPIMYRQSSGSIINTSSGAGLKGSPNMVGYVASKHAVVGLTRTAAKEAGPKGVRVNSIHPGPVEGRMMEAILGNQGLDLESGKSLINQGIPMNRFASPDEIVALVEFLASERSSYCNGGCYTVDGGFAA